MIDLYADDLTLSDIMEREDKYILVLLTWKRTKGCRCR